MNVEPFAVELAGPLETAAGTIDRREGFLVSLSTDGAEGVGEATPLPGWTESREECRAALERAAEAAEGPDATAGGTGTGSDPGALLGAVEGAPAARHGVSLAVLDARARAAERPLYRTLGADRRVESVPVNATVGEGDPGDAADAARGAVAAGFGCLKVKVGARELDADLDRLRAVRGAVGDGPELRADANGAWSRPVAERAVHELADLGVAYVEQPLPAADLAGHADLRGRGVGIALDESVAAAGLEVVLAREAADVVVLKPMALGGPDRARDAAERAREANVVPVVTTTLDAVHARTAAVHLAASLGDLPACGLATADRLATDLAPDPAPVRNGEILVPQGPGNLGDAGPSGRSARRSRRTGGAGNGTADANGNRDGNGNANGGDAER